MYTIELTALDAYGAIFALFLILGLIIGEIIKLPRYGINNLNDKVSNISAFFVHIVVALLTLATQIKSIYPRQGLWLLFTAFVIRIIFSGIRIFIIKNNRRQLVINIVTIVMFFTSILLLIGLFADAVYGKGLQLATKVASEIPHI